MAKTGTHHFFEMVMKFGFFKFRELQGYEINFSTVDFFCEISMVAISCIRMRAKMLASWDQLRQKTDLHGSETTGLSNHYKTHAEVQNTLKRIATEFL